jgi:hypothetical protein
VIVTQPNCIHLLQCFVFVYQLYLNKAQGKISQYRRTQVTASHEFSELAIFNIEVPKLLMFPKVIFDGKSNICVKY